jgi:hypothetical protein
MHYEAKAAVYEVVDCYGYTPCGYPCAAKGAYSKGIHARGKKVRERANRGCAAVSF